MDIREIRELSDEKLLDELEDQKEAFFNLRFQKAFGQLEDFNSLKNTQRTIARIKTIIRERQLVVQKGSKNG